MVQKKKRYSVLCSESSKANPQAISSGCYSVPWKCYQVQAMMPCEIPQALATLMQSCRKQTVPCRRALTLKIGIVFTYWKCVPTCHKHGKTEQDAVFGFLLLVSMPDMQWPFTLLLVDVVLLRMQERSFLCCWTLCSDKSMLVMNTFSSGTWATSGPI